VAVYVPKEAIGYTIATTTSRIIDYGTEFGVLVCENGRTETHVYNGKVSLESCLNPASKDDLNILTQGCAATVDASGRIREIPYKPHRIVRSMPEALKLSIPGKRLNLADVVGGGNGFGTGHFNSAIDTTTGRFEPDFYTSPWENRLIETPPTAVCRYVHVPTLDYVDGVFSPTANPVPMTVSSVGHTFTLSPGPPPVLHKACPGIGHWSSIDCLGEKRNNIKLDGRTYGSPLHPVILMQVNKGITFDLHAIRADMPEIRIERFTGLCSISPADRHARASFYVLVDGVPRFTQKDVSSSSSGIPIHVELKDTERFLTLIVVFTEMTPIKWACQWTHRAVFAEPSLELARKQEKRLYDGNQRSYP
jgi:hypothetical protein